MCGADEDDDEPPSAKLLYGICCGAVEYAEFEYEYGLGAGYGV